MSSSPLLAASRLPRPGDSIAAPDADNHGMQSVECLRCGHTRGFVPGLRSQEAGECPQCRYVGWAFSDELTEPARRVLRDLPLESRLRLRTV